MPKITLSFDFDLDGVKRDAGEVGGALEDALGKAGGKQQEGGIGKITSMFRDINELLESMTETSDKFNKSWKEGLNTDKERLKTLKEIGREQRDADTSKAKSEALDRAQGGGGGGGIGGGGIGGGRYGAGVRIGRARGVIGAVAGMARQEAAGLTTTSDYLAFGSSIADTAAKGAAYAAVAGVSSAVLGPAAVGLYGISAGLRYSATLEETSERHRVLSGTAYAGGGQKAYDAYADAAKYEYGAHRRDAPSGSYGARKFGITPAQLSGFTSGLGKAGGDEAVTNKNIYQLGALERHYGASREGMGLMGVAQRSGAFEGPGGAKTKAELFAKTLGVAIATEMDHGRIGESFEQVGNVMSMFAQRRNVDEGAVRSLVTMIGQMGDRYKGTGPGAQQAVGAGETVAKSKGSFGTLMRLERFRKRFPTHSYTALQAKMKMAGAVDWTAAIAQLRTRVVEPRIARGESDDEILGFITEILYPDLPDNQVKALSDLIFKARRDAVKDEGHAAAQALFEGPAPFDVDVFAKQGGAAARKSGDLTYKQQAMADVDAHLAKQKAQKTESAYSKALLQGSTPSSTSISERNAQWRSESFVPKGGMFKAERSWGYDANRNVVDLPGDEKRLHLGEDIYDRTVSLARDTTSTVFAPAAGEVTQRYKGKRGWTLRIKVDAVKGITDYTMRHLQKPGVRVGEDVARGQQVAPGLWDLTSRSHVHMEARLAGKMVEASRYLDFKSVFHPEGIRDNSATYSDIIQDASGEPVSGAGTGGSIASSIGAGGSVEAVMRHIVEVQVTPDLRGVGVSKAAAYSADSRRAAPGDAPALSEKPGG